ncbi:hypothetical protein E4U03_04750 [Rothia nasimurium]|uniref:Uncharacterized protein n=1 Tax=Rothia nasimurium TaxID=85336 RepID=A0A4Y9F626_9MICC|nr:hypothetical protein [Rothia nasimurium]MBF0807926.1 hypothetical protein [Rothia nasimurium]TFU22928.1 hypothetical protein E4U03_04750 [Rothia nasimurium]
MKLTLNNGQEIELDDIDLKEGELVSSVVLCFETVSMKDSDEEQVGYTTTKGLSATSIIGMLTIARMLIGEKVKGEE